MVSARCQNRLSEPIPCDNFRKLMGWRLCRAWDLIDKGEATNLGVAISKAAEEVRAKCYIEAAKKGKSKKEEEKE
jgi:hypothetical protein